jgi:hypothetical protein
MRDIGWARLLASKLTLAALPKIRSRRIGRP